jgi:hypothetical protein
LAQILGTTAAKNVMALGGLGLGVASGLVTAGVQNLADTTPPQTIEDLRDTENFASCLDNKWRLAGSNLSDA